MELILKQKVKGLGEKGDIVFVKPGYGGNFLIPKKKAILATKIAKKINAEDKKQQKHKHEKVLLEAQKYAEMLKKITIKVKSKVGEQGKIFGSITTSQLVDSLKEQNIVISRKSITIEHGDIKRLGVYQAKLKLHKEIIVNINFEVISTE